MAPGAVHERPFLVLQARPETDVADDEFAAILRLGGLGPDRVERVRLERDEAPDPASLGRYAGVILGGGPGCVSDPPEAKSAPEARIEAAALALMPAICEQDLPYLGCCYGLGALAVHLGAPVGKERYAEPVSAPQVTLTQEGRRDPLLAGFPERFDAFVGHKEAVQAVPEGAVRLAGSEGCPIQILRHRRNVYATQFHPEADGSGFALRIRTYRAKGYFAPEEADGLIAMAESARVVWPGRLLAAFVRRYCDSSRL